MIVVVEDYSFSSKFFRVEQAEVVGQLKLFIVNNSNYCYVPLPPTTIKKSITANGKATKSQVIKKVKDLGFKVNNSHEADSVAVAYTYFSIWGDVSESIYSRTINL
jgi:Holliday junction resolvasome RuvABC endonuclease subunit